MVFIDGPPLPSTQPEYVKQLAQFSYNKLMSQTFEPFHVVSVTPHMLAINKNGIYCTVTINRAPSAPSRPQESSTIQLETVEHSIAKVFQDTDRSQPQSPKGMLPTTLKDTKVPEQILTTKSDGMDTIVGMIPINLRARCRGVS